MPAPVAAATRDGVLVAGVAHPAVADRATHGAGCSPKWSRALGARAPQLRAVAVGGDRRRPHAGR